MLDKWIQKLKFSEGLVIVLCDKILIVIRFELNKQDLSC